ncbi:MAG: hypothetical protein U5L08_16200 [Xanthomonadales bacterium]|nr:hypothetical protein [Xanthomonadales bacterium]
MKTMTTTALKEHAHQIIDRLPEAAGWEELAETVETILDIEAGLADSAAGRVTDTDEVRREFGLE